MTFHQGKTLRYVYVYVYVYVDTQIPDPNLSPPTCRETATHPKPGENNLRKPSLTTRSIWATLKWKTQMFSKTTKGPSQREYPEKLAPY